MESHNTKYHKSVLIREVLEYLDPKSKGVYVDATFGGGGHTKAILDANPNCTVIAFDWDKVALDKNGEPLKEIYGDRLKLVWGNFAQVSFLLKRIGVNKVDGMLADFGTSQFQIKEKAGFSFKNDAPLDMRMSTAHQKITAADVLNTSSADQLRKIFWEYGEERAANKIVKEILDYRKTKRFKTTGQLVEVIEKVLTPQREKKIHPATRVFQALRIYVNDELGNINSFLKASLDVVKPGGRVVCISFHSLEDRLVKRFFQENKKNVLGKGFEILTPKVVVPTDEEISNNPSSRSSKLRAAQVC